MARNSVASCKYYNRAILMGLGRAHNPSRQVCKVGAAMGCPLPNDYFMARIAKAREGC